MILKESGVKPPKKASKATPMDTMKASQEESLENLTEESASETVADSQENAPIVEENEAEASSPEHESAAEEPKPSEASEKGELVSDSAPDSDEDRKEEKIRPWTELAQELEKMTDPELQLKLLIEFMEAALCRQGSPNFRDFWQARKACLPLFKGSINPALRSELWKSFSDLSKEARRLKEILDEQTAFAVEQIDKAVEALEQDIGDFDGQLVKVPDVDFGMNSATLEASLADLNHKQRELNLLNAHAGRINALRKELIKTEMRIRHKNKFFQRLSEAGDKVFPRRKELIKEVSDQFVGAVESFVNANFGKGEPQGALFVFREEIKALQGIAKVLTLNTHAFTHTRTTLSKCWDEIRGYERERKKHRAQKKAVFQENAENIQRQIVEVQEKFGAQELKPDEAGKELDKISSEMRDIELGRDEVRQLRDLLTEARQPLKAIKDREEEERRQRDREREQKRREAFEQLQRQIQELLDQAPSLDAEGIQEERQKITDALNGADLKKDEKHQLERALRPLRDVLSDKREQALLALPEDDRQRLSQMREILKERKARRQESKQLLENYRKAQGASGMDFEKALEFTNLINEERERHDKMAQGIEEIQKQIRELEDKA